MIGCFSLQEFFQHGGRVGGHLPYLDLKNPSASRASGKFYIKIKNVDKISLSANYLLLKTALNSLSIEKLLRGNFLSAFHRNKKLIIFGFLVFGRFENESFLK